MKKHSGKIVLVIILANITLLLKSRNLPIPAGVGSEIYYSHVLLKLALGNVVLASVCAYAKLWRAALVLVCFVALNVFIAASA